MLREGWIKDGSQSQSDAEARSTESNFKFKGDAREED